MVYVIVCVLGGMLNLNELFWNSNKQNINKNGENGTWFINLIMQTLEKEKKVYKDDENNSKYVAV